MITIEGDNLIIPIIYSDEEKLIVDTTKMKEDFEEFMESMEEETDLES